MPCILPAKNRLICALDYSDLAKARAAIIDLKDHVGMFKIGLELYALAGREIFDLARQEDIRIFFDSKFHDIPNTVHGAVKNSLAPSVAMLNVHATGGSEMMKAARAACDQYCTTNKDQKPLLIAVTILTSISESTLEKELAVSNPLNEQVVKLSLLAKEAGLDGVVASPREAREIKKACTEEFLVVTPGIRPSWSEAQDQKRILTPARAIESGADFLVVGRPITQAEDPVLAANKIVEEIETAINQA